MLGYCISANKVETSKPEMVARKNIFWSILVFSAFYMMLYLYGTTKSHLKLEEKQVRQIRSTRRMYVGSFIHYTNVSMVPPRPVPCRREKPSCTRYLDVSAQGYHGNCNDNNTSLINCTVAGEVHHNNVSSTWPKRDVTYDIGLAHVQPKSKWVFHIDGTTLKSCPKDNWIEVAILPRYFAWAYNFGHFMLNVVSTLHDLMADIRGSDIFPNFANIKVVLIFPPHFRSKDVHSYLPLFQALGIHRIHHFYHVPNPTCVRHVFLPHHSKKQFLNKDVVRYFTKQFNVTDERCPSNNVVLINRKGNRKIINGEEIASYVKSRGFNASMVYLEHLTIQQQMQEIHCADVLIGVQGAGLTWFPFIPLGAALIEVGFEGWPNDFYKPRLANSSRSDLIPNHRSVLCDIRTPDGVFMAEARRLRIKGQLDDELKRRVYRRSKKGDLAGGVYKKSDCFCSLEIFTPILDKMKGYKRQFF